LHTFGLPEVDFMKRGLIVGGFLILAALAIAGWGSQAVSEP
jgi:hypothetical protein